MQYNYEIYLERMQGVILEHNYDDTHFEYKSYILKILVNNPFNAEISISMNTDIWQEYVNYSHYHHWKGFLENHPEKWNRQNFYCNPQNHKFYMVSTIDDKGYPVWEKTTLERIIQVSHLAWRFSRHINAEYNRFHAGQTCEFSAYAIDNNERFYKPSTIDENFSKYNWIYEPLTFKAGEITDESIEHLIAKTPISKEVTDKMVRYHKSERKDRRRANITELRQNLLDKLSKFARFVEKYPTWSVAVITAIVSSLFTFFLSNIGTILKWFLK